MARTSRTAIMDGARQIVQPAFVSLLCICIVFVPMFALAGVAGFLFMPMAMSVVFAMIASFILSRTLVPTLALYLLKPHWAAPRTPTRPITPCIRPRATISSPACSAASRQALRPLREGYRNLLALAIKHRRLFVTGFLAAMLVSFLLFPFLGSNFFPSVDTGQITLHVRAPVGTRIEDTTSRSRPSKPRSATSFPRARSRPSSTIWACLPARST